MSFLWHNRFKAVDMDQFCNPYQAPYLPYKDLSHEISLKKVCVRVSCLRSSMIVHMGVVLAGSKGFHQQGGCSHPLPTLPGTCGAGVPWRPQVQRCALLCPQRVHVRPRLWASSCLWQPCLLKALPCSSWLRSRLLKLARLAQH